MSRTPGQLLVALISDAADAALASDTYRDVKVDRARFVSENRAALLLLVARQCDLRTRLARSYAREPASAHPLLADLLGEDGERSAAAAHRLGTDLTALAPATPAPAAAPAGAEAGAEAGATGTVDARRAERLKEALRRTRLSRDQARGQLDHARRELRERRQERDSALSDLDEALTVVEALRGELAAERARAARLADDPTHAAAVLARALRPSGGDEPDEGDVRERDRRDGPGSCPPHGAPPTPERPAGGPVADALAQAGVPVEAFLAALDAITAPPPPPRPAYGAVALTRSREVTVTPLGGGTDIGGSCVLIEAGDARILVDAGTRPNQPLSRIGPPDVDVALAGHLDAVVITHAHNDHAGFVPALTSRYPRLNVVCTPDTAALLPTMWTDSVKVFDRLRHQHGGYGERAGEPPYTQAQVRAAQERVGELAFGRTVEVADGVTVELFPAGHILGAAGVVVTAGTSRVTVTGDVSNLAQASVSGLVLPASARRSDLLVIESTYCRPGGQRRASEVDRFVTTVEETVNGGGRVLVPAFALGRAQEVALTLRHRLPDVPVLIDGLATTISRIYEQRTAGTDRPLRIYGGQVREVRPGSRREHHTAMRRGVIVTTSGMLTAGPAVTWARWILPDPRAALLVSGYQDEESAGAELLRLAEGRTTRFRLDGEPVEVNAYVAQFGLSAHADRAGLMSIIGEVNPGQVMLVHGIASAQREFADHLRWRGYSVAPTSRWPDR